MSRRKSSLIQAVGGYALVFITIVEGLVLIPIYFRKIGAENYGVWITLMSILTVTSIVNFGVNNVINQRISFGIAQFDDKNVKSYFVLGMIFYLFISLFFLLLSTIISVNIQSFFPNSSIEKSVLQNVFWLGVIFFILSMFNDFMRGVSQAFLKPLNVLAANILGKLIGIITVLLLMFNGQGLISIPLGLLCGAAASFVLNILITQKNIGVLKGKIILDIAIIKECLSVSPSLLGARVGTIIFTKSPYVLLTYFDGASVTAVYAVLVKVGELMLQMVRIAINAVVPALSHLSGESINQAKSHISTISFIFTLFVIIAFGLYVSLNYHFIQLWVPNIVLSEGMRGFILWFGLAMYLFTLAEVLRSFMYSLGEFKYVSNVLLVSSSLYLLLLLILVPNLGMEGIAYSFLTMSIVSIIILVKKALLLEVVKIKDGVKLLVFSAFIFLIGYKLQILSIGEGWLALILWAISLLLLELLFALVYAFHELKLCWLKIIVK